MRPLWQRPHAAWMTLTGTGAGASAAFGLLVLASLLASLAIPRESVGLRTWALQRTIAAAPSTDRTVTGTVAETSMPDKNSLALDSDIASVGAALQARLAAAGVPASRAPSAWQGLTTGYVPATGTARITGYGQPKFELAYRTALDRYGRLLSGRLPAGLAAGQPGVVQAAATAATAARFGLRVGTRLSAGPVQLVITGITEPADLASAFWSQDLVTATPEVTPAASPQQPYWAGALFVGPGALPLLESSLDTDQMGVTWVYPADLSRLTAGQAGGLDGSVTGLAASGATLVTPVVVSPVNGAPMPVTLMIDSQIPALLSPFLTAESAVTSVLELLYVSLAVLGAVVVLLGARLVAQRRAAEFTLMRARGAALYQLSWLVVRASALIAVVAGAVATAIAVWLTPGDDDAVAWWLAGIAVAVTLVGPVWASVVPQRVAAPAAGRPARAAGGRGRAARRLVVEAALVAMAVGGLVVLRNQGLDTGGNGLYSSAAPVLLAVPVAVVVLRCYPPLARELARLAGRSRGVVAFVGLARATRTPPGAILPSFALVLVLATVAFPDMISTSVAASQQAASWQQVGADAIITAPRGAGISPALERQVAGVPGVVSTVVAEVDPASLGTGFELPVVFVDPVRYAAVADQAPGPRFPLAALSGSVVSGAVAPPGVVGAVATAAAAQLAGPGPDSVTVGATTVKFQVTGRIGSVPGVAGGAVLLLPRLKGLSPNLMLVAGPGLDAARLDADVTQALPGATVTLRSTALAALSAAPVLQAAQAALSQGTAAAAGFGVLILLLSLLLTARTREMTLARLATMGLRRWQAQLLLATETLPPVVAAAAGGVACAWLLAPLVGPSLDLAAYSGTGAAIAVTPAALPLAAAAAALVVAALLVLAAQAVIAYHRGSARALRIAD